MVRSGDAVELGGGTHFSRLPVVRLRLGQCRFRLRTRAAMQSARSCPIPGGFRRWRSGAGSVWVTSDAGILRVDPATGKVLAARTGLSDQTGRRWLAIMRQEGAVELVGDSAHRHARYPPHPPGPIVHARPVRQSRRRPTMTQFRSRQLRARASRVRRVAGRARLGRATMVRDNRVVVPRDPLDDSLFRRVDNRARFPGREQDGQSQPP